MNFRLVIEGQVMATTEDEARAFVMNSVSFSAVLGQTISSVRVAAKAAVLPGQEPPPNLEIVQ
jgi:hypothetical protein